MLAAALDAVVVSVASATVAAAAAVVVGVVVVYPSGVSCISSSTIRPSGSSRSSSRIEVVEELP